MTAHACLTINVDKNAFHPFNFYLENKQCRFVDLVEENQGAIIEKENGNPEYIFGNKHLEHENLLVFHFTETLK